MVDCLINGNSKKQYTENVRAFSLRQHFHSNAAYESLRLFFNGNLPTKRTLQLWYTSVDGSPGINLSALDILREKAAEHQAKKYYPLHVTLMCDEMSIRKDVCWSDEQKSFLGFSTITSSRQNQVNQNELEMAKNALVFLIVGSDFKIPVAYHLIAGFDGADRADLTRNIIRSVEENGIRIISLTSDGLYANLAVAEHLGAKLKEDKPYFHSPTFPQQKIYVIFDPPHMLKLIRLHFSRGKLHSQYGMLNWHLLQVLVERQRGGNFNLSNKLTEHHMEWQQKPMNVMLAAQTISKSVADAIEQLQKDGYEEFENAEATVEFLRNFNDIFDILNVADKDQIKGFKQPLCESTAETIFSFAERMQAYIKQLKIDVENNEKIVRKPILESRAQMGFRGFYNNLICLKGIYNDFVRDGPIDVFYTKIFGQDHLETFFSLVQNRQGRNDNPNAVEFASAYKKLLICHPLTISNNQNVISNATGLLTVSSRPKKQVISTNSIEAEMIDINHEELNNVVSNSVEPFDDHLNAYVALCVEKRTIQDAKLCKKGSCPICGEILLDPEEKMNDDFLAMKSGNNLQPCKSTHRIVILSEAILKIISSSEQGINFDQANKTILKNLKIDELYSTSNFEHDQKDHKEDFLKRIVKAYLTLKSQNIGKRIADEERGAFIRSRLKARTHNAGQ